MDDAITQGLPILVKALTAVGFWKYPLVAMGALFEGPVLTVASGFLLHTNVFSLWPLFIALAVGDLLGDVFWYFLGRYFAAPVLARHGKFLTLTPETFEKMSVRFHAHQSLILLTSKITMGFGMALALLMTAGAAKIPFRAFMFWNALGEIFYVAALLSVGYFFGQVYGSIAYGLKTFFVITGGIFIMTVLYFFAKYLSRRFS